MLYNRPPASQLFFFLSIFFACYIISNVAAVGILLISGLDLEGMQNINAETITNSEIKIYKLVQIILSIFLFILPPFIFSRLRDGDIRFLQLHKGIGILPIGLTLLFTLSYFPLLNLVMEWNQSIALPEALKDIEIWMRAMEDKAAGLTEIFLAMETPLDLAVNLFMVAIIPAIGEEMVFRGVLQQLLKDWLKNAHVAIFISAAIFSAFHFQFFGFFPRMLIGIFLGYLFYWSGNLWYPIIGHLFNNGLQVVLVYAGYISAEPTSTEEMTITTITAGTIVLAMVGFAFYKHFEDKNVLQA